MESQRRSSTGGSSVSREEGHQYKVREDSSLVPADIGLKNAQACIGACFEQFVDEWYKRTNGGFEEVCKQLSQAEPNTDLWTLYCCDSTYCGVWAPVKGKSPSVDLIINKCQNVGNYEIYDPGPPPSGYSCQSVANASESGDVAAQTIAPSNSLPATATATSISSAPATESSPSSVLNSTMSDAGVAPSTSTGLTEGSKAAIGICASLAIIAIIFLVGFLISRRRPRPQSYFDSASNAPHHGRSFSEPPNGSRTPLITPPPSASSKGPPRTPPPRLGDRKFLPSLLRQGDTANSSLTSGLDERIYPHAAFGLSPEKSITRHERRATTSSIHNSPFSPSHPAAVHFPPHFLRDSDSSYSSGRGGASTTTIGSNKAGSVRSGAAAGTSPLLQPLSPTRPPRSHDERLDIPHLTTPAGPPPNRALPAPPPYHPVSPTFTVSPISPSVSPGLPAVRPLALGENKGHVEASNITPLPSSTKDLSNLTESYARETSESWGSWSGTGGGAPGVGVGGGKKRSYGNNGRSRDNVGGGDRKGLSSSTVSLQELDLEKLGGKY